MVTVAGPPRHPMGVAPGDLKYSARSMAAWALAALMTRFLSLRGMLPSLASLLRMG